MIDPSLRLRRSIHLNNSSLTSRILSSHPTLLQNPDYSPTLGQSNTNLHLASLLGHASIVSLLLELGHENSGISLNEQYETPLMLAARKGHVDCVLRLCESGKGDVGRQDGRGRDAVMEAARGGHDTVLQILLTYSPPPSPLGPQLPAKQESRGDNDGKTGPGQGEDNENYAKMLLQHADHDGNTALHFASSNGHLLVLRTLLAAGADSERRNAWSWTPVAYSATVAAEVYFKGLVAEVERKKDRREEVVKAGKGAGVRIVGREVDDV